MKYLLLICLFTGLTATSYAGEVKKKKTTLFSILRGGKNRKAKTVKKPRVTKKFRRKSSKRKKVSKRRTKKSKAKVKRGKLNIVVDLSSSSLTVPGMGTVKIGYGNPKKYGKRAETPTGRWKAGKLGHWRTNKRYNGKKVLLKSAIYVHDGVLLHEGRGTGPVSHGCIRVPPKYMRALLRKAIGAKRANTTITITIKQ